MTQRPFQSLAQAVEAYYEELRRFVQRRTGSQTLAEDVVQETWIRASTSGAAMPNNPRAYLYRMAGNIAVDHLRRRGAQARLEHGDPVDACREDRGRDQIVSPAPGPDAVAAARQELAILCDAIRELPEKCRLVFLLYRGQGLTMREVAARLDISEKTVENHIARAMLHCRRRLREAGRNV
jgi:RNA polymerase sigma-70 factor (ECF subfamily)